MSRSKLRLALSVRGVGFLAAICGVAAGCAGSGSDRVAFEVAYTNENTTPAQSKGYYITAGGDVYRYDYYGENPTSNAPPSRAPLMTEAEIRDGYGSSPRRIASVDSNELQNRISQVEAARNDPLVIRTRNECGDYGQYTFRAYLDLGDGEYASMVIGYTGREAASLASADASNVVSWLSKATNTRNASCSFESKEECDADSCAGSAPWCKVGTSSTAWVEATECDEVDDCKACEGLGCVIDSTDKKHCTIVKDCEDERGVCASGQAWCGGALKTGFSCSNPDE